MDTGKHTIYEVGKNEYRYMRACFDGLHFWWPPSHGTNTPLVKWSSETGVIKEFPDVYTSTDSHAYLPCIACNGYIWLLPVVGENAYKIDISTDCLSIATEFESGPAKNENGDTIYKYTFAQSHGNCIYTFYAPTGTLIEYDCVKNERREKAIGYTRETAASLGHLLHDKFLYDIRNVKTAYDCFYYEGVYTWLDNFISFLTSENNDSTSMLRTRCKDIAATLTKNADGTSGKKIHDYIMKLLLS
jgi:hypothetical protein